MENCIYGCLPYKKDLRDYKICSINVEQEYPKEFLLNELPRIKNQKNINSCCAHATSSLLEYHNKNHNILSTNFLYGIQKKLYNQDQMGMYLVQALKITKDYGDALEEDCKGNDEIPKVWDIAERTFNNQKAMSKAYYFRTLSYYLCETDNDIKYALMNYGPVLGAVYWRSKYTVDKDAVVHFDTNSNGGGHAVLIIGWDEDGWVIQNSWGEDFGYKGKCTIEFDYGFVEARAVIDYENEEDLALMKPKMNKLKNRIYKILNYLINKINPTVYE